MKSLTFFIGLSPFERPDVALAIALQQAGVFPVIHLGRTQKEAELAIRQMKLHAKNNFGVCVTDPSLISHITFPEEVDLVILPSGVDPDRFKNIRVLVQVTNLDEAEKAVSSNVFGLIVKGNESAGLVGEKSSFILFQELKKNIDLPLWVQGGMGVHSSAAMVAAGASGVVLDSQLALFPEASTSKQIREVCKALDGTETRVIDNFRVLVRPGSPKLSEEATFKDIEPFLGATEIENGFLPVGQDIAFAYDYAKRYKTIRYFVDAIYESIHGHLRQANDYDVVSKNNPLANELEIEYPIAQGPMTRVSDVPEFAAAVATGGGLPFIALSLLTGDRAKELLMRTKTLLSGKAWGVGILGFVPQELRKEQLSYLEEVRPPVALIAGGRPSQAKPLEKLGIKTFLHVPSFGLLDIFLKEGARRFVFEGRECGGHVGPLSSMVLWEKQIDRLLEEEEADQINVLFAGGIHDALSAAIVSVMSAPLAAKGAKIGVLMGTSYLYTKEAVETGAIVQQFQQEAIKHKETVLVETGPGHVTRCLNTPFVEFFANEKKNLILNQVDKNEIGLRLETLNVGRLRIASKGVERQGELLLPVKAEKQLSEGMYMIGQVAALRDKLTTIRELHQEIVSVNEILQHARVPHNEATKEKALNIAIIGMACIYPDAPNVEEFWKNILAGKDCITEVPDERWNKAIYYDPASTDGKKTPSKWGGFIPTIHFDPVEFGIPPQSLSAIDPAQLLSLKVAKEALADAGYDKREFDRENTSVIFGVDGGGSSLSANYAFRALYPQIFGDIPNELDESLPSLTEDSFPGILSNVVSGRIANRLDLGGSNYVVDAACASSLTAIDVACQELTLGKSNMVLAGGADLHNNITDYLMFSSTKALSKKGKCFTFDSEADGIVLGEGVAVLVLKRLEDAKRDGDRVYAVIQGLGSSSDGKSLGLTAPRKLGQVRALERAYRQAGIAPSEVGLMEAHGTGTIVGDRTELSSMTDLLIKSGAVKNQTQLGSVKSQIGHTKCAAGMAGLIKMALSVYHGVKPPTLNLKQPNKFYKRETSPFVFNDEATVWMNEKRVAGASAFGFGGTNFHAVLEKTPEAKESFSVSKSWPAELFVFRGTDRKAATNRLQQVKTLLKTNNRIDLKDIAFTLSIVSKDPVQFSIVAEDYQDLLNKIEAALEATPKNGVYPTKVVEGKVAFMFSGQGSQRINMARDLFVTFPSMRNLLKQSSEFIKILFPDQAFSEELEKKQAETVKDTRVAQPLLGIVDYAIASLLRSFGIEPDMVAGHSYGELPALCFANVFDEEHLVPLSKKRGESILKAIDGDSGTMLAANCQEQELLEIIAEQQDLYLANHNSPNQLVVSGTTDSVKQLSAKLKTLNKSYRQLEVACAFHSPLLARSQDYFYDELSLVSFRKATIPVWSNTTASVYPEGAECIKQRLAEHLVKPVLFYDEVKNMYEQGARVFIETGPGKVLAQLVGNILEKEHMSIYTEQKGVNGVYQLLLALAQYVATGREISINKLFEGRDARQIDLDFPDKYRLSSTTWNVSGHFAFPVVGKLPAHGAKPITQPLKMMHSSTTHLPGSENREHLVLEYLKNVNNLVQAQRDVMVSYLGQGAVNRSSPTVVPVGLSSFNANGSESSNLQTVDLSQSVQVLSSTLYQEPSVSIQDIKSTLLLVVSEKTGYPQEMLGMEMDLEADLSIDSIKRIEIIGELKSKFDVFRNRNGNEEEVVEKLAAIKTLQGLVEWITENAKPGDAPVLQIGESAEPLIPQRISPEAIRSILIQVVSEKTGYPPEMLGMDMDLEADLSIDSIKRIEIIGELKSKMGVLQTANGNEDEVVEKLASLKTLTGLVDWITGSLNEETIPQKQLTAVYDSAIPKKENLIRLRFDSTASIPEKQEAELSNKKIGIAGIEKDLFSVLKEMLETKEATVSIVSTEDSLEQYDGFVFMDLFTSARKSEIADLFSYIKKLDPEKIKWVYVVTDFKSGLEKSGPNEEIDCVLGYQGFLNSLNKEWNAQCRTVYLDTDSTSSESAEIVLNELLFKDEATVVDYGNGYRNIPKLVGEPINREQPLLSLGKDSVVVVLGGAQGITSDILIQMSSEFPCHYILIGRSPAPDDQQKNELNSLITKDAIRKQLIAARKFSSPRELEEETERIYKRGQIMRTLKSIEANGATVTYHSCDVRNKTSLENLLEGISKKHGRIDGVIHAAGFLDDKFFDKKTSESFEKVYSTKVMPLKVLSSKLFEDTKFVILFSSISSVMGNKGQTDYAAANSVLDHGALVLQGKIKGRVITINWGPWRGAGMVSPALEKEYERRGIELIPLKAGVAAFMDELKYGRDKQVLIASGDPNKF